MKTMEETLLESIAEKDAKIVELEVLVELLIERAVIV